VLPPLFKNLADAKALVCNTSAAGKAALLFEANLFETPLKTIINEHSEQARALLKNGPRDVPRCGALCVLQKPFKNSN
jgi:hypothetical protein